MKGKRSRSGVFVFEEFRDNLIIDRFDPIFAKMRGEKIQHLKSENSEDAITWNVFRSLSRIDPKLWLGEIFETAFGSIPADEWQNATIELWPTVPPPPSLRLFQKDEGDSEIDVRIETERFVLFIETKYKSDISLRTTNNSDRDQLIRNIDVGSWYAAPRDFYFALLMVDDSISRLGAERVTAYTSDTAAIRTSLPHRSDGLINLKGVGQLRWAQLASVLEKSVARADRQDDQRIAETALAYLETKGIVPS